MKEYAHKRRNARESLIVVGDQVLLKQSKAEVLTPAFDPRPFSVIGVKGSMITVKRGREIKSRNSSHCKLLKHAREDEYVAVDLDQEGLDTSSAEETEIGAREDLRLQPDNLAASSEMTIGVVVESDGHPYLSDCKGPKTETASLCRKKYIEDSDDDEEEFSEEFYESPSDDASETCHESDSKGKKRKKRLSSFELSEIIVAKEIKTRTQLLAYAYNQKCEGKNDIAEFIVNRGPV